MKQLVPYLAFPGTCEEALNLYQHALGGNLLQVSRYGDSQPDAAEDVKQKIYHAHFQAEGIELMACDALHGEPPTSGSQVQLSINLSDEAEQTQIFERLAEGGTIVLPLGDMPWGARFGMLVDKFGVHWMTNCDKPQP